MVADRSKQMDTTSLIIILVVIIVGLTVFLAGLLTALRLTRPRL
jgi:hypothetical protein